VQKSFLKVYIFLYFFIMKRSLFSCYLENSLKYAPSFWYWLNLAALCFCVALKRVTYRGYFCWWCRHRCCRRPLKLVWSISQSLLVGFTSNLVCMLLNRPEVQCTRTGTMHFLFFELLPIVNFHTLFLSGPFLLMYKSYGLETS
jgi:hypothetical protein